MRVDVIAKKKQRVLHRIAHEGQVYVMAPKKGAYTIQLYNDCGRRRLAVVTVDGVNVVDGKDGNFDGNGYVMGPWERLVIPGWRRDDNKVAAFTFKPEDKSYANKTGRGTKNVGVIGVAVFDEKPELRPRSCPPVVLKEEHHHHHHDWYPIGTHWLHTCDTVSGDSVRYSSTSDTVDNLTLGETYTTCSVSPSATGDQTLGGPTKAQQSAERCAKGATKRKARKTIIRRRRRSASPEPVDVGTGYGQEVSFATREVDFEKASEQPAEIVVLRYATWQRLESWGVPVDRRHHLLMDRPEPFPASSGPSCPPPPDWCG
jgi:hypothetical protein